MTEPKRTQRWYTEKLQELDKEAQELRNQSCDMALDPYTKYVAYIKWRGVIREIEFLHEEKYANLT
jgi:hypothetical protein